MACFRHFLSVSWLLSAATAILLASLLSCTSCSTRDRSDDETPTVGRYLVDAEVVVVDRDGVVQSTTPLRSASSSSSSLRAYHPTTVETEKGRITGLGYFDATARTVIRVSAKSGYKYRGMYFRYSGGYDKGSYPTIPSRRLSTDAKSVTVTGNLTVIALFEEDDRVDVIIE